MGYLVNCLIIIYIPISTWGAAKLSSALSRRYGIKGWSVGPVLAFILLLPVTWEIFPVKYLLHQYCESPDSGLIVYIEFEQWQEKHKLNLERKANSASKANVITTSIAGGKVYHQTSLIDLVQRSSHIWGPVYKSSSELVSAESGQVLARFTGYESRVSGNPGSSVKGFYHYKSWLRDPGCATQGVAYHRFKRLSQDYLKFKQK